MLDDSCVRTDKKRNLGEKEENFIPETKSIKENWVMCIFVLTFFFFCYCFFDRKIFELMYFIVLKSTSVYAAHNLCV